MMLWNRLSLGIVGVNSLVTFKRLLADHLGNALYMSLSSGSFVHLLAGFKLA